MKVSLSRQKNHKTGKFNGRKLHLMNGEIVAVAKKLTDYPISSLGPWQVITSFPLGHRRP